VNQESTRAPQSNGELRPPTDLRLLTSDLRLPTSDFRLPTSCPHPDNRQLTADNRGKALRAFTLIELLVVITIIIILMGLLFPAFRGAQNQAKKVQAKNDMTQIVNAVNAFYTEYGVYPSTYQPEMTYDGKNGNTNDQLFNALRGNPTYDTQGANPRNIVFISPPIAKDLSNPRGGIGSDGQWYDPWGKPYYIRLDTNFDNLVTNPYSKNAGFNPLNAGVIAWSFGPDNQSDSLGGSGGDKNSGVDADDVLSWQ
jgi:type II secretory pathway pseudopilin PulG